ncbi:MAG: PEP-CTERM sorting domain-containing protein [Luteolibacter sp.]
MFSGYQNNGTAFREFQVEGSSAVSAVPEPSGMLGLAGLIAGSAFLRRRIPAREQREMYRWPAR